MFLLKLCAKVLIWGSILLYLILLGVVGWLFLRESQLATDADTVVIANKELSNKRDVLLTFAIISWVVDGLSLIVIVCLFKRIRLAVAIVQTASDFVRDVCEVMLVPIIMFVVAVCFLIFWFFVTL
jgi:solute carrier family 44 (choline transporter-like protein), member 2/4/5